MVLKESGSENDTCMVMHMTLSQEHMSDAALAVSSGRRRSNDLQVQNIGGLQVFMPSSPKVVQPQMIHVIKTHCWERSHRGRRLR